MFATLKLVDLHFRQRMNLKFDTNLLPFWFTFWLMDKVTKFSSGTFSICFQNYRSGDHVVGSSKNLNSRELNASTTNKSLPNSFFDYSTSFPKFSTPTTIIKAWAAPLPRQNKCRWCPTPPRRKKCSCCLRP